MTDEISMKNDPVSPVEDLTLPARGIRVRRLRLLGITKHYDVSFLDELEGGLKPLGLIAGRINTGKTAILRFIDYAMGASSYPNPSEVERQVRGVLLEIQTPEGIFTLERGLGAKNVLLYSSSIDALREVTGVGHVVEPISDPGSISQWLLATVGLQDVNLKEAPTKDDSGTDRLSFRDLMWLCLYYNERVGSQQLLHVGNHMKELKLRQVVDAVFGVHDNDQADLARRVRDAQSALDHQRRSVESLQEFVEQQEPQSIDGLHIQAEDLDKELAEITTELEQLTAREAAASDFASQLRQRQANLAAAAAAANALVRDRESLINRFASLRAQYADDVRKLTLLVEAGVIFDQLSVTVCPVCFNSLPVQEIREDGTCSLCRHDIHSGAESDEASQNRRNDEAELAKKELRAAKRRYKELDEYWQRLNRELPQLRERSFQAAQAESLANGELDKATRTAVSPFLGERNELEGRRRANLVHRNKVANGIKLYTGLQARLTSYDIARRSLEALRKEQRETKDRPDRTTIVRSISDRYSAILHEIRYPKVDEAGAPPPYLDDKLVPHVRGQHFKEASSGGQVLVTLAWMLAIFETAYEANHAHPGFLMIDTPQKNLGGIADDAEFADIHLVERLYDHIQNWLEQAGQGAQIIVVDNTPPTAVEDQVVVRYTRDPAMKPFGLIDNETGTAPGTEDVAVLDV
ncbi:hypothetical protein [Kocuria sp. cx-455]|uniref:hypothetical protein n=1 Tax=Kocuria sp. cx-455 TaxID=2771377 RepID=UPI003D757C4F